MKTKKKQVIQNEPLTKCHWCGKEKKQSQFFKISLVRGADICTDCINAKYTDLCTKTDKAKAILACCHYLDTAFNYDICKSLAIGEGIGIYLRQLNLRQNQDPENFEQGLIHGFDFIAEHQEITNKKAKNELTEIINKLEMIKNEI